jgi:predicted ATP-dependent serine protease
VLCSVEGSRPILVEVQALVGSSNYGTARRMASGLDQQRLSLLLAVLEKRAGLNLAGDDVFVNIAGGMTIDEPACDLGVLAAIASSVRQSFRRRPRCSARWAGWRTAAAQAALRARGGADGFRRCVMPDANIDPNDRRDHETRARRRQDRGEALDARCSRAPGRPGRSRMPARRRTPHAWLQGAPAPGRTAHWACPVR